MKEGQCGWRVGRRASIDKLLPVLDRYDWMPAVMNTKQDDISFLTIFVYIFFTSEVWTYICLFLLIIYLYLYGF